MSAGAQDFILRDPLLMMREFTHALSNESYAVSTRTDRMKSYSTPSQPDFTIYTGSIDFLSSLTRKQGVTFHDRRLYDEVARHE